MHQKQYKIQHFSSTVPILEVGILGQRNCYKRPAVGRAWYTFFSINDAHGAQMNNQAKCVRFQLLGEVSVWVADPLLEMQPGVLCHSLKNTQQQAVNDILAAYVQVDLKKNMQVTLVDSVLYTVLKESGQTLTESVFI